MGDVAPAQFEALENDLRFNLSFNEGYSIGLFLDQRDNRKTLASLCAGRRVLDLCCNTGGFAVYAKTLGKAEEVVGVDLDTMKQLQTQLVMRQYRGFIR